MPVLDFDKRLSQTQRSFLRRAAKLAETSGVSQKHGALIVKGGRVLSTGVNSYSNNPQNFPIDYFAKKKMPARSRNRAISVHAEVAAMRRLSPEQLRGSVIYVARVKDTLETADSAPCQACAAELLEAGVKRVIFT